MRVFLLKSRLHCLYLEIVRQREANAATLIQSFVRRILALKRTRLLRLACCILNIRSDAARSIQRLFSHKQLLKRAKDLAFIHQLYRLRHEASIEIQKIVKGFLVRKDLEFTKHLSRTVRWPYDGREVWLVGTITPEPWGDRVKMQYSRYMREFYSTYLRDNGLPSGVYYIKFIVEGQWTCDGKLPIEQDESGNFNNIFEVPQWSKRPGYLGSLDRLAGVDELARYRNPGVRTMKSRSYSGNLELAELKLPEVNDSTREVRLLMSSYMVAHPTHPSVKFTVKGSADACLIDSSLQMFALADGVGEWQRHGLDPCLFPKELLEHLHRILASQCHDSSSNVGEGLKEALRVAYDRTESPGSSTVLLALCSQSRLYSVLLGDCGILILRKTSSLGQLTRVFRSQEQQHYFNCPYQLARIPNSPSFSAIKSQGLNRFVKFLEDSPRLEISDTPEDAMLFSVQLLPGDIIVAGTDGLFDNLYDNEIAEIATALSCLSLAPDDFCRKLAYELTHKAISRAFQGNYLSPFAKSAKRARRNYIGGKLDDISVVTAKAV